jgi:hypothetical protein
VAAAAGLCCAGAISGEITAESVLPADITERAAFVVAAIGALAALLVFAVAE